MHEAGASQLLRTTLTTKITHTALLATRTNRQSNVKYAHDLRKLVINSTPVTPAL